MQPPRDLTRPETNPCAWDKQLRYIACRNRYEADYEACLLQWVSHAEPYCLSRAQEEVLLPADVDQYKDICIKQKLSDADCEKAALASKRKATMQKCLGQVVGGGYYWDHLPSRDLESKSADEFCTNEWLRPCKEARDAAIKLCPNR